MDVVHSSEEAVFAALDAQPIGSGPTAGVTRVVGVHIDGRDVWVQLAIEDGVEGSVILHLMADATIDDALTALRAAESRESFGAVLEVAARQPENRR